MADHNVMLRYGPNGLEHPEPIRIRLQQTISFKLSASPIKGGSVRITMEHPALFSRGQFLEGENDLEVVGIPFPTTYKCELLMNGKVISTTDGSKGGEMVPDAGN